MIIREDILSVKRIVVKVGTSTLTHDDGNVNLESIEKLSRVLSDLANSGKEVILVSSGAIGVGCSKLGLKERPSSTKGKQAVAAVGQCELMNIYSKFFEKYNHTVAQILLTRNVVEDEHMRNNVCNTFETLLEMGIIPIVNENDTVSIDEIENMCNFGDNDTLSAIVSKLTKADLLVILSDIDGFYDCDPRKNSDSKLIKEIVEITNEIEACAGGAGTDMGTGGMVTKLSAAKIANSSGVNMILTNGKEPKVLLGILDGEEIGTLFRAN
ncbi:glutamate 5-kinase [Clostridium cavendishii DSM 21758]|uniref:Glutamate 5-kinase n=1 Tax=Clostridium cavendishii DSM 21758 TaxID=1121302 RepID=A0A1M6PMW7_9CLOT|nr:glutamate 5-kinase [Clostridium cavendishii]SHK09267.1 glutamate 5-kinase [Clostridium cavendishii DSM 21758]